MEEVVKIAISIIGITELIKHYCAKIVPDRHKSVIFTTLTLVIGTVVYFIRQRFDLDFDCILAIAVATLSYDSAKSIFYSILHKNEA